MHPATTHSLTAAVAADRARDARRASHVIALRNAMPHLPDTDPPAAVPPRWTIARLLAAWRSPAGQW